MTDGLKSGGGRPTGLAGALASTRVLATLLYEVKPGDPETYILISRKLKLMGHSYNMPTTQPSGLFSESRTN